MKELIDRDDAIRIAEQGQVQGFEWQFKKLCSLVSEQPEVICCEYCTHSYLFRPWDALDGEGESRFCRKFRQSFASDYDMPVEDDDYCSFAERK